MINFIKVYDLDNYHYKIIRIDDIICVEEFFHASSNNKYSTIKYNYLGEITDLKVIESLEEIESLINLSGNNVFSIDRQEKKNE